MGNFSAAIGARFAEEPAIQKLRCVMLCSFRVAGLLVSVCSLAACSRGATTVAAPTSPGVSRAGVSVSGVVRESGAQALSGVAVRAVGYGESAQTDGRGV